MSQYTSKWADVLINYCLDVKPREYLGIIATPEAMPLIEAVYAQALLKGAYIDILLQPNDLKEFFFTHASDDQLTTTPKLWNFLAQNADKYLIIHSHSNTRALSQIAPERHALYSKGYRPILDTVLGRSHEGSLQWCLTQYPSPSLAQEANMSTSDYTAMTIQAGFLDHPDPIASWKKQAEWQEMLKEYLSNVKILRFVNEEGTDLEVDVASMQWVNCAGGSNFPDGEVFTGPNLMSPTGGVNGTVSVSFPTIYKNVEVRGINLVFEKGKVVKATSETNEAFLHTMINQDKGASYVGEIAIGTNWAIQRGTTNILFDEKIGGTFHLALGKGYPETGNSNMSALHWDLVTDLRASGRIYADGKLIFEKGRFTIPTLPSPTP